MTDQARQRSERYLEAMNLGDMTAIDETRAAGYVYHQPPDPDSVGLDAHREFVANMRQMMPDVKIAIDDHVVAGDRVAVRWTMTGTHTGQSPLLPVPPTGRSISVSGCAIDRVEGDKIVETWNHADYLGLLQQVGVVPPMQ